MCSYIELLSYYNKQRNQWRIYVQALYRHVSTVAYFQLEIFFSILTVGILY